MRVGIAGVGGIGSNVAVQLVRSGLRELILVDFDCIESSNLNRQFYFADQVGLPKAPTLAANLRRIDPQVRLIVHELRLDRANMADIFAGVDVVVEGFDGAADKKALMETVAARGIPVVSASGVAGRDLSTVTVRHLSHGWVVGDMTTAAGTDNLFAPKVTLVASIMANLILEMRAS